MECVCENLNGTSLDIRSRFARIFPIDKLVDEKNELAHQYGHGRKLPVTWDGIWITIHEVYPALLQALEDAVVKLS